jgi:hypothetical protein
MKKNSIWCGSLSRFLVIWVFLFKNLHFNSKIFFPSHSWIQKSTFSLIFILSQSKNLTFFLVLIIFHSKTLHFHSFLDPSIRKFQILTHFFHFFSQNQSVNHYQKFPTNIPVHSIWFKSTWSGISRSDHTLPDERPTIMIVYTIGFIVLSPAPFSLFPPQ